MNKFLSLACALSAPLFLSQSAFAEYDYMQENDTFKRFSVSAGWLHAAPQGNPTPIRNTTVIRDGTVATNGSVKVSTVRKVIDPNQDPAIIQLANDALDIAGGEDVDLSNNTTVGDVSGTSTISGLESFATLGTGLESDRTDTVGLLFNYHLDDHWSIEAKAGLPPTVDILGKGTVITPLRGKVQPSGIAGDVLPDGFNIAQDIHITDMAQGNGIASSARAWLPAAEVHYQIGKPGVNKLRPYVGVGFIYAYFNDIELNPGIRSDLEAAGHQIQNIKEGMAGASLEGLKSSSDMHIDVEADTDIAPLFIVGTTYDFDESWFAVGSISYAELDSDTTITVKNDDGEELIKAVSTIDIDPYISYLGVGYRF